MSIIKTCNVKYSYDGNRTVLKNISTDFEVGKIYAILGPSGCGKTTLLSLLGGLDSPSDGQVLFQGEDIEKKGLAYHGLMGIRMPENYITMYQAPGKEEAGEMIRRAKEPILHACSLIGSKKEFPEQEPTLANVLKSGVVNELFYPLFVTAKGYHTTSACIGCGKCAALCPLNNIRMEGKQPVWGSECTQCMACICGCPAKAVEYRKKTQGKDRYYLEG